MTSLTSALVDSLKPKQSQFFPELCRFPGGRGDINIFFRHVYPCAPTADYLIQALKKALKRYTGENSCWYNLVPGGNGQLGRRPSVFRLGNLKSFVNFRISSLLVLSYNCLYFSLKRSFIEIKEVGLCICTKWANKDTNYVQTVAVFCHMNTCPLRAGLRSLRQFTQSKNPL